MPMPTAFRRVLYPAFAAAVLAGPVWGEQPGKLTPADASPAELDKTFARLANAARASTRLHFDPQAVLETVGREPTELADWVRKNTAYVPYLGALRGPAGTLMDGTGNSFDRAWLLAEMIRSSGYEVRLARATLSDADARTVLAAMTVPERPKLRSEPVPEAQIAERAKAAGVDPVTAKAEADDAAQQVDAAANLIRQRTDAQGKLVLASSAAFKPNASDDEAFALKAAKDHWWVQTKTGDAWTDFDPTRPADAKAPAAASTVALADDTATPLPEADSHTVRVRLLIERDDNGRRSEQPAFDRTYRTAELAGRGISITQPALKKANDQDLDKASNKPKALRETYLGQSQWMPLVTVGDKVETGRAFDDTGVVSEKAGPEPAALSNSTSDLFGGLGGGGSGPKGGTLTAETIEYTMHSPGREDVVLRRPVFDLIGPAARAAKSSSATKVDDDVREKRARLINARVDVLALGGELHCDGIQEVLTQKATKLRGLMQQVGKTETLLSAYEKAYTPDFLYSVQLLRQAVAARPERTYLDRPNVLTAYRVLGTIGQDLTCRVTIDVSYNPVAVRPANGGEDAFTVRVLQGVADTVCERAVLRGEDDTLENTTELFAKAADARPVAARTASDVPAAAKSLSADVQARVTGQIEQGYALVLPPAPVTGAAGPRYGWYRVDPKTGDTIGVNDAGFNAAITERAAVDKLNSLRAAGAEPITSLGDFAGMGLRQIIERMGYSMNSVANGAEMELWRTLARQFMKWGMQGAIKGARYGGMA